MSWVSVPITGGLKTLRSVTGSNDLTVDVVEIYDLVTDRWTAGPPIPTRRGYIGAALVDDRIYVVGGKRIRTAEEKEATGDDRHFVTHDNLEALDLRTQTWSCLAPLPSPRAAVAATGCRGRIYSIAGVHMDRGGDPFNCVDVFDTARGRWERAAPFPVSVWGPAAVTVDDRVYGMGGAGGGVYRGELFVFDPDEDRWAALAPMPTGRSDLSAVVLGRRIYALGGRVEAGRGNEEWGCLDAVEVYDVDADSWTTEAPMPQKSAWQAATVAEGRIFVMGGARAKTADSTSRWESAEYLDGVHELILD